MKPANLLSVVQTYKSVTQPVCEKYLAFFKIKYKESELHDLYSFIETLNSATYNIDILDNFYLGYTIPQISKEFDLLKFSEDSVVNIELKCENTGEKIRSQIIRNQYYLSFLKKKVYSFTYVSKEKQLYTLDEKQSLVVVDFKELIQILLKQNKIEIPNINELFNPSNYLVSPFNSTEHFIKGHYFLTAHQEEIKRECINDLNKKGVTFLSICGKAGTGKTLLVFDIAKELISTNQKVLLIHCGNLNPGHIKLRDEYKWNICPIKSYSSYNFEDFNLIVIDETQRIYPYQLDVIIKKIKTTDGNCIFSYDQEQCLRVWETNNNISHQIIDRTASKIHRLTEKIRTNKEIASFINLIFNKDKPIEKLDRSNIDLTYFLNCDDAKNHIELLRDEGWKIINFTPSNLHTHTYDKYSVSEEDNVHAAIGQEFDNVIAVIDQHFYYKGHELETKDYTNTPYYDPSKMLLQVMTRTRKKLSVIIINNEEILSRCLSILESH